MGYDTTRAKEYYRTNFPNSSLKFRWLNGKATKDLRIGNTKQQIQKIWRRDKTLGTHPAWVFQVAPFRQIAYFQDAARGKTVRHLRAGLPWTRGPSYHLSQLFLILSDLLFQTWRDRGVVAYLLQNREPSRIA
jgi:hypothetical protein